MRKLWLGAGLAALLMALGIASVATAGSEKHGKKHNEGQGHGYGQKQGNGHGSGHGFRAKLQGYSEVPANSTAAKGKFKAQIVNNEIQYTLSYSGLEGPVHFAHIHFGQEDVNGGVAAFLCGGGSKPACPESGEVTGTIAATDVIGPVDQGIAAGEIDELIAAMKHGKTYANIHSDKFPNGEIRGQINGRHGFGH